MVHNDIDKQSRFREGQTGNVLEVAQPENAGRFFIACRLLASTRCLVGGHDSGGDDPLEVGSLWTGLERWTEKERCGGSATLFC